MAGTGVSFIRFFKNGAPIPGESFHKSYPSKDGWIEIGDFSWDVESEHKHTGTGLAVGRAKPGNFTFTHNFDRSSPALLQNMIRGTHFDLIELDMCKVTGDETPKCYFRLSGVYFFVTKVSSKGDDGGQITQDVEGTLKQIQIDYGRQQPNGQIKDAGVPFIYNFAEQSGVLGLASGTSIRKL